MKSFRCIVLLLKILVVLKMLTISSLRRLQFGVVAAFDSCTSTTGHSLSIVGSSSSRKRGEIQHRRMIDIPSHHRYYIPTKVINSNNDWKQQRLSFPVLSLPLPLHQLRSQIVILSSSSSSSSSSSLQQPEPASSIIPSDNNMKEPDIFLSRSYRITQYGSTITAIILFFISSSRLPTVPSTITSTLWGSSMGWMIASQISSIMQTACQEQRLSSPTYQRLNIGLFSFYSIGLVSIPGEAAYLVSSTRLSSSAFMVFITILRLWGCYVSWNGWSRSLPSTSVNTNQTLLSFAQPLIELGRGIKETIVGLRVNSSKKALTYRNCLLLVCSGIISHIMEGYFTMRYQNEFISNSALDISLQWSAVSRLFLIATMIYSLKDAGERDRLTGTTFIQLNILIGVWATIVGFGQSIYPIGYATYRSVLMYAFAIPFWLKAYKSQKEKTSKLLQVIPNDPTKQ